MKLLRTTLPTLHTPLASIDHQVRVLEYRDPDAQERRRLYATQAWRKLRAAQLKRQPWCQYPGCGQRASVADHILGHGDPGWRERFFNPRLLQSLCATCHSRKTSTTEQAGAGGRRVHPLHGRGSRTHQDARSSGEAPTPLIASRSLHARALAHGSALAAAGLPGRGGVLEGGGAPADHALPCSVKEKFQCEKGSGGDDEG